MNARLLLPVLLVLALVGAAIWLSPTDIGGPRSPDRPGDSDTDPDAPPTFGEPVTPSFLRAGPLGETTAGAPDEPGKPGEKPDAIASAVGLVLAKLLPLLNEANDPAAFLEATGSGPWELHKLPRPLVDKVIAALTSEDPGARFNAALVLSALELAPEDIATIRDRFDAELSGMKDQGTKGAALALAFALSTHGDRHGTAGLADTVRTGAGDAIEGFRRDAALVIGLAKDTESSSLLRDLLATDPDRAVRKNSAVGLGRIGGDENRTAIADALNRETDIEVRAWAALAAGRASGRGGDDGTLTNSLATDGDGEVRAAAAYSLGKAGGPGTTGTLISSFYGEDHDLGRVGIVAGIARRGGSGEKRREFLANEGTPFLAETVKSSADSSARFYAITTLSNLPRTDAGSEALSHAVASDRSSWVRRQAVTTLAKKDGKAALPTLTAALESEKSKPVRRELEKAIKRLSK